MFFYFSEVKLWLFFPEKYRLNDGNEYLFQAKDDVSHFHFSQIHRSMQMFVGCSALFVMLFMSLVDSTLGVGRCSVFSM